MPRLFPPLMLLALYWGFAQAQPGAPGVRFEPSPVPVVEAMTELAAVKPGDVVYDLGCGDGRIVIAAAKLGARAVRRHRPAAHRRRAGERARRGRGRAHPVPQRGSLRRGSQRRHRGDAVFVSFNRKLRRGYRLSPGTRSHWHDGRLAAEVDVREPRPARPDVPGSLTRGRDEAAAFELRDLGFDLPGSRQILRRVDFGRALVRVRDAVLQQALRARSAAALSNCRCRS